VALYEHPNTRFVAGFIGSPAMNFFELPLQHAGGQAFALLDQERVPLPAAAAAAAAAVTANTGRVVLGMRPEHLHLGRQPADVAAIAGRVVDVEFTGAQSQFGIDTAVGRLVVCVADRPALRAGDEAVIGLAAHRLHWFDADSGRRLTPAA